MKKRPNDRTAKKTSRDRKTIRTVELWPEGIDQLEALRKLPEIWGLFGDKIPSTSALIRFALDNLAIRALTPEGYAETRKGARERYRQAFYR